MDLILTGFIAGLLGTLMMRLGSGRANYPVILKKREKKGLVFRLKQAILGSKWRFYEKKIGLRYISIFNLKRCPLMAENDPSWFQEDQSSR